MDATQSNRLARGLFAASQSLSQDVQLRMAMAQQAFKERVMQAESAQRGAAAAATLDVAKQREADRAAEAKQASQDRADARAQRALEFQQSSADRQQAAQLAHQDRQDSIAERLQNAQMMHDIAQQRADTAKQALADRKGSKTSAQITAQAKYLEQANAGLDRIGKQIGALKAESAKLGADTLDATQNPALHAQKVAQLDARVRALTANQTTLTHNLTAGLAKFGTETGAQPSIAAQQPPKPVPSSVTGNPRTVTSYGGKWYPSGSPSLPKDLQQTLAPAGTKASEGMPDGTTLALPNMNQPAGLAQPPALTPGATPDLGDGD